MLNLPRRNAVCNLLLSALLACSLSAPLLFAPSVMAQNNIGGSLRGVVKDSTGASLPGGTATLTNNDTNANFRSDVTSQGEYRFSSVPPGTYTLVVTSQGFSDARFSKVVINLNQAEDLPVTLAVGSAAATVEVSTESEKIVTLQTSVTGLFTESEIKNLPLNGRDYSNLIYLSPGVTRSASGTGQGSGVVAAGTRPTDNNYLIDGADNNDPVVPSGAAGASSGQIGAVPIDQISEFTVISANGSAEFGRSSGAVINVVTKSGTNTVHGTLFEFVRNPKFNTRQWFDPLTFKSALKQNDFGGRFGLPIFKNKTFMAGAYEGYRQRSSSSQTLFFPSTELLNTITDPALKSYLAAFFPAVSNGGTAITAANYSQVGVGTLSTLRSVTNNLDGDTGFVRFDQNFSDRHQAFLTGSILNGVASAGNSTLAPFSGVGTTQRPYHFVLGDNFAFTPHVINTARVAFQRTAYSFPGETPSAAILASGSARTAGPFAGKPYGSSTADPNGVPTLGSLNGLFTTVGVASNIPQGRAANVVVESDAVTWEKGRHQLKFGGELRRIQENGYFSNAIRPSVTISDSNLASLDAGTLYTQTQYFYLTGSSNRGFRQLEQGYFAQDSWRANERLTLELGVRYELFPPFNESKSLVNNAFLLDGNNQPQACTSLPIGSPNLSNIALLNPTAYGKKAFCPDYNNFAPRIGFSYDVNGKGTTVLRGGWGYYYDRIFDNVYGNTRFNAPQVAPINLTTGVYDGTQASAAINTTQVYTGTVIDPHLRTPYTQHFNLTVSQQIDRNTSFTVGYVGSIGMKLFTTLNPNFGTSFPDAFRPTNAVIAGANGGNLVRSQSDINAGIIRGPLGNLSYRASNGVSNFHSLEMTIKHRTSHGLSGQVAYTFAHSMDTISDEIAGNTDSSSPQSTVDNLLAPYLSPGSPCPIDNTGTAPGTVTAASLIASSITSPTTYLHALQCATGNNSLTAATAPSIFVANYVRFRPIGSNYGDSSFDVRQRAAINVVYALPFGRDRAYGSKANNFVDEFIGGWNLSSIIDTQTGTPFIVTSGVDSNRDGTTNDRALLTSVSVRNPRLVKNSGLFSSPNVSRFQCSVTAVDPVTRNKTCADGNGTITFNQGIGIIDPTLRMHRGALREAGIFNWDAEVFKNFKVYREGNLRFSADGFNVLNRANYGVFGGTLTSSSFARSTAQRAINNTYSRQFQFALKYEF